jgi:hypothetical protein
VCRSYGTKQEVGDPENVEQVGAAVENLLKEAQDSFSKAEAVFSRVFKNTPSK